MVAEPSDPDDHHLREETEHACSCKADDQCSDPARGHSSDCDRLRAGFQVACRAEQGLGNLPRQLQILALQPAQADQRRERRQTESRVHRAGRPFDPRSGDDAAGEGRNPLLLGFLQQSVRSQGRHRRNPLVLRSQARRRDRRAPDPLALQPRHGDGRRQALCRHRRRALDRPRHEDRPARLGYQASQLAEAHCRISLARRFW